MKEKIFMMNSFLLYFFARKGASRFIVSALRFNKWNKKLKFNNQRFFWICTNSFYCSSL